MINVVLAAATGPDLALARWKTDMRNGIDGLKADRALADGHDRPPALRSDPLRGPTILVNDTLEKAHAIVLGLGARMTF